MFDKQHLTSATQVEALTSEDLDRLFTDGRKSVTGEFVPINIEKIVTGLNIRRHAVIDAGSEDTDG